MASSQDLVRFKKNAPRSWRFELGGLHCSAHAHAMDSRADSGDDPNPRWLSWNQQRMREERLFLWQTPLSCDPGQSMWDRRRHRDCRQGSCSCNLLPLLITHRRRCVHSGVCDPNISAAGILWLVHLSMPTYKHPNQGKSTARAEQWYWHALCG